MKKVFSLLIFAALFAGSAFGQVNFTDTVATLNQLPCVKDKLLREANGAPIGLHHTLICDTNAIKKLVLVQSVDPSRAGCGPQQEVYIQYVNCYGKKQDFLFQKEGLTITKSAGHLFISAYRGDSEATDD